MAEIRTVEFDSLPKAARERFVAITLGTGALALGFGDRYKEFAIHGPVLVVIAHRVLRGSPFPFLPGRYLFATDVRR